MTTAVVADEGAQVVLVINGKRVTMPPEVALQMARQLQSKAMVADEYANANRIIMDQAIMQRAGLLIGLSSNPKIVASARQEAQWNSTLRRHMPLKGIQPRATLGTPTLRKVRHG